MALNRPQIASALRAAATVLAHWDPRPTNRLVKLRQRDLRSTKLGLIPIEGDADGSQWWTNGEVIWRDSILDEPSRQLVKDKHKAVKDQFPVTAFWPRSPGMKLVYKTSFEGAGKDMVYDVMVYEGAEGVLRFVPGYARPPKVLYASRRAAQTPVLVTGEEEKVDPRAIQVGRLKPHEDERNEALVDHPDPAQATILVMPLAMPDDLVERLKVQMGLLKPEEVKDQDLADSLKKQKEDDDYWKKWSEDRTLKVPDDRWPAFEKLVKRMEKTAAKLGVKPPVVEVVNEHVNIQFYDKESGEPVKGLVVPGKEVKVRFPEPIKFPGDFQVLAKITPVDPTIKNKNVVFTFTKDAIDLPKSAWSMDMKCEHCGKVRRRSAIYLVENQDSGERKHVGSSCLDDYTGHEGYGQFCSLADNFLGDIEAISDFDEEMGGMRVDRGEAALDPPSFLALVANQIHKDGKFIPRSQASPETGTFATADAVLEAVTEAMRQKKVVELMKLPTPAEWETAKKTLEWVKTLKPKSDFEQNLVQLSDLPHVPRKFAGMFAAMVSSYQREAARIHEQETKQREQARLGSPYPQNVKEGDRYDFVGQLVFTTSFDTAYGTTFLYKFNDANGLTYTWKASNKADLSTPAPFEDQVKAAENRLGGIDSRYTVIDTPDGKQVQLGKVATTPAALRKLVIKKLKDGTIKTPVTLTLDGRQALKQFPDRFEDKQKHTYEKDWVPPPNKTVINYFDHDVPIREATAEQLAEELAKPTKQQTLELQEWFNHEFDRRDPQWNMLLMPLDKVKAELEKPEDAMNPTVRDWVKSIPAKPTVVDLERGKWYEVRSTIKKFGEYKGEKQTDITRCVIMREATPPGTAAKASARMDQVVAKLHALKAPVSVLLAAEQAAAFLGQVQ